MMKADSDFDEDDGDQDTMDTDAAPVPPMAGSSSLCLVHDD